MPCACFLSVYRFCPQNAIHFSDSRLFFLKFPVLLYDIWFLIYNNYDDVVEGKRYFGPN